MSESPAPAPPPTANPTAIDLLKRLLPDDGKIFYTAAAEPLATGEINYHFTFFVIAGGQKVLVSPLIGWNLAYDHLTDTETLKVTSRAALAPTVKALADAWAAGHPDVPLVLVDFNRIGIPVIVMNVNTSLFEPPKVVPLELVPDPAAHPAAEPSTDASAPLPPVAPTPKAAHDASV